MEAIAVIAESKIRTAIENGEFDPTERARLSRLRCDC
jgi:hypothetical protein